MLETIQNGIQCLWLWGIVIIIFSILLFIKIFFTDDSWSFRKRLFEKKYTEEIFEEINNFTDEEREKLLFLVKDKNREKRENIKNFFNDV